MRRALTTFLFLLLTVTAGPAAGQQPEPVTYRAPVSAPIVDGYRPPVTPYGAGNRGLEYATEPGTPVRAAAAGTVTFAGPVGGDLHVTVLHADRLRTTYAFLATAGVRAGQQVMAGQVVGTSGPRLLWTARLGDAYLDPGVLLVASGHPSVRLVPNRTRRAGLAATARTRWSAPATAAAAEWALGGGR